MNIFQMILNWVKTLFFRPTGHVQPPTVMGSPEVPQPILTNDSSDFTPYVTQPYDKQWMGNFDSDACVTESGIHVVEQILNYLDKNNLLPQELLNLIDDPKIGFRNSLGFIELSVRFSATMNGTTEKGLPMDAFWQCLNRDGFVSKKVWPDPVGNFTREEYYKTPDLGVIEAGKLASRIFQWDWRVIVNNNWNTPDIAMLKEKLKTSPLQFASCVCPHDDNNIEHYCGVKVYQHARVVEKIDDFIEVLDSEWNISPLKKLSVDFPLACIIIASLKLT